MSGFAVLIAPPGAPPSPMVAQRLLQALAGIGPDRQASTCVGRATLCHSLLAVTPEEAADEQPASIDPGTWLAGDLRLDAREDLVSSLRQHGRRVDIADPDSILVLNAWAVWRRRCVEHLLGDFSFVVWDEPRQELFAARDHFGIAALLVAEVDGALLVSNAMRAMRKMPGLGAKIDPHALGDFIVMGHCADPRATVFSAIRRLPAAHALTFQDGRLNEQRYWEPPPIDDAAPFVSGAEEVERFSHHFALAVADRMRCTSTALSLSGGMDSGLIAGFARQARGNGRIHAYTVGYDWLIPDNERYFAGLTAHHLDLAFHPRAVDDFVIDPPGGHWRLAPEPSLNMRVPAGGVLAPELRARGVRLVLNGLGGDQLAVEPATRWADLALGGRWRTLWRDGVRYRQTFGRRPPLRASLAARRGRGLFSNAPRWSWLRPEFAAEHHLFEHNEAMYEEERSGQQRASMARDAIWSQYAAATSPEQTGLPMKTAFPFFDVRVWEAASRLAVVPWLTQKHILRRAGAPLLPPVITRRRKVALGVFASWEMAKRGIEPARTPLSQPGAIDEYVDRGGVLTGLQNIDTLDPQEYDQGICRLAGLAEWFKHS